MVMVRTKWKQDKKDAEQSDVICHCTGHRFTTGLAKTMLVLGRCVHLACGTPLERLHEETTLREVHAGRKWREFFCSDTSCLSFPIGRVSSHREVSPHISSPWQPVPLLHSASHPNLEWRLGANRATWWGSRAICRPRIPPWIPTISGSSATVALWSEKGQYAYFAK